MSASSNRSYKDTVYQQFARIGKAVASPRRLEILDLLCQSSRSVEALAREIGQSVANTSQHLQVLRAAHLVETEREGHFIVYRLAGPDVCLFFLRLRDLGERQFAEVERVTQAFLEGRDQLEPVARDALVDRMRRGEVTLLDVRPDDEYATGHIPGALSVPIGELEQRLEELPPDRDIVAYCRGRYCVMAVDAVQLLRAKGFNAVRFEEGVPEWRARGLQVEAGHGL